MEEYTTMPNIVPQDGCPKCNEKVNKAHYSLHKQQVEPCEACAIRLLEQVHSLFKAQVASQQTKAERERGNADPW